MPVTGCSSGRGTQIVDIKLKISPKYKLLILNKNKPHLLFQCQQWLVLDQMDHPAYATLHMDEPSIVHLEYLSFNRARSLPLMPSTMVMVWPILTMPPTSEAQGPLPTWICIQHCRLSPRKLAVTAFSVPTWNGRNVTDFS